ncbi:TetR/AcrR family transcriptional regulator [Actinomadura barringtoniae]|uniref:TetR/AcrR family transcriptional regulator n=1 Tax=Actinomadura barringtoniae TaxID=1427535 RepID=A0A939PKU5_9ACTN|nr:TetR/AcrR family transcriptional regulator [Actinomadura barringtoniae]MBO2454631.1 TetR/AcrR family transcriptional regulator [Actinomadura barringtoniae]
MPPRARRTQAQRTAETRRALLDATYDSLVEGGYRATTTTEVAHRAGVSLGALLHHFPTKADLLSAAAQHVFERRQEEFLQAMNDLDPGADRFEASVDLLWRALSGPAFTVSVELVVAARTDPDLAASFVEVDRRFMRSCQEMYAALFPPEEGYPQVGMHVVWALLDGLALSRTIDGYQWHPVEEVLDTFKAVLPLIVESTRRDV